MRAVWMGRAAVGRQARRVAAALGLAALVGVLAAGCGIPTNSGPQAIAKSNVPSHLLNPTSPSTSTTLNPPPVGVTEQIFLVDPTLHLVAKNRNIAPPASLSQVLNALLLGPTAAESLAGIQSFVSGSTSQGSSSSNRVVATVADGVATINFVVNPVQVVGSTQPLLAIAQIVYTATGQPGVNSVLIEIAGLPIDVPTAPDGALVSTPVTKAQYLPQAPVTP
jgi:Sporulation and spore germination